MWKASPKVGGRGGKQKWVPKGESKADEGDANEEAAEEAPEAEEPITSPILLALPTPGPNYDRVTMLRVFGLVRNEPVEETKDTENQEKTEPPEPLHLGLTERPTDDAEGAKLAAGRRGAPREPKKVSLKRGEDEELGTLVVEGTPSSAAQKIALSQELTPGQMGQMGYDPALLGYLNSMAFAMPPMMPMYGAQQAGPTTVMLRNIPNRYTRDMLIERLNRGYEAEYDFVYLPIDFNSKCNVGYAFINFRTPAASQRFVQEFHGAKTKMALPGFSSAKVCEVSYARVQGRDANMDNLRDDKFIEKLNERPEWQPLFYDENGNEIPFSKTLGKEGKRRRSNDATPTAGGMTPVGMPGTPVSPGFMMGAYGAMGMMYPPYPGVRQAPAVSLTTILPGATSNTMLMVRAIPVAYTRNQLVELLNGSYRGVYDFVFLPGDNKGEGNRGFGFINFRNPAKAQQFTKEFHNVKVSTLFPGVDAEPEKVCEIQNARLNSIEKTIERMQTGYYSKNPKERYNWYPLLFDPSGEPVQFPLIVAPGAMGPGAKVYDSRDVEQKVKGQAEKKAPKAKAAAAAAASSTAEKEAATAEGAAPGAGAEEGEKEKEEAGGAAAASTEEAAPAAPATSEEAAEGAAAAPATEATLEPEEKEAEKEKPAAPAKPSKGEKQPKAAKGKGKGKANQDMMMPGTPTGMPGFPYGMSPFPNFGFPGGYSGAQAAQYHAQWQLAARAAYSAHITAHAAAAAHAGGNTPARRGNPGNTPSMMNAVGTPSGPVTGDKKVALRTQIEFYFSTGNLMKDIYLRSHMDGDGWTPLELISSFPKVKSYGASMKEITEALADSRVLQVDSENKKVRLKEEETRNKWAKTPAPNEMVNPSATGADKASATATG